MLEIVTHFMDLHGGTNLFTVLMCAPLLFIIIDIITGVARAWRDGEVSSKINREGAGHKFAIILAIVTLFLMEFGLYVGFGIHFPVIVAAIIFIVAGEILSIIENICLLNPSLCPIFAPVLKILRNSQDQRVKDLEELGDLEDLNPTTK